MAVRDVTITVIASYMVTDDTELRFVQTPSGWKPDLLVNHTTEEVSKPPSCFKPTDELLEKLNAATVEQISTEPVGVYNPCRHQNLKFNGHIAAPGYGQSWECADCGEAMWSPGGAEAAVPYAQMDRPPELSPEDVI